MINANAAWKALRANYWGSLAFDVVLIIVAFPTYFVIDGDGQIVSRSVGYSTSIGLQTRVWMNTD